MLLRFSEFQPRICVSEFMLPTLLEACNMLVAFHFRFFSEHFNEKRKTASMSMLCIEKKRETDGLTVPDGRMNSKESCKCTCPHKQFVDGRCTVRPNSRRYTCAYCTMGQNAEEIFI